MKSGYAFIPCPTCASPTAQTIAILGDQVFACCHACQTIRMPGDDEIPASFERLPERRPDLPRCH